MPETEQLCTGVVRWFQDALRGAVRRERPYEHTVAESSTFRLPDHLEFV